MPLLTTTAAAARAASAATAPAAAATRRTARAAAGRRSGLAAMLMLLAVAGVAIGPDGASPEARLALLVFASALIGWCVLRLDDLTVALLACLALVACGVLPASALYAGLGQELIWLLLGAFLLAAALQQSGVAERVALRVVGGARSIGSLFQRLNLVITATAFVIPSTSARAALLLPVFLALSEALSAGATRLGPEQQARLIRALALLFPSVILLSAGASLLGAGAHLIALQFIARETGLTLGFVQWALLALPLALLSSSLATWLILHGFLDRDLRGLRPNLPSVPAVAPAVAPAAAPPVRSDRSQRHVAAITALAVFAWCLGPLVDLDATIVALLAGLLVTTPALTGLRLRTTLKTIEWNLLLFLATTLVLGEVLLSSGAAQALAAQGLAALPLAGAPPWLLILTAAGSAVALHLFVPSRTARAVVLLPTVVGPLAAAGADPLLLALVCIQGSGFCQTFTVSAKPLAVYEHQAGRTNFAPADLLRLSAWLAPLMVLLLLLFATQVWPAILGTSLFDSRFERVMEAWGNSVPGRASS